MAFIKQDDGTIPLSQTPGSGAIIPWTEAAVTPARIGESSAKGSSWSPTSMPRRASKAGLEADREFGKKKWYHCP